MEKKRGSFSGGLGFVLAAAGSAVGLGNLWRFPYLAAQYGGGIFILVYIILALTFGFALMTTEIAIGRKTKKSPIVAYKMLSEKFSFLGYIAVFVPAIILPYYCVIGGWLLRYVMVYIQGLTAEAATDTFFGAFIGDTFSPLFFFMVFLILTALVVIGGVEKGIEKFSKVLMPILIIMIIGIAIYILCIPGTLEGVKYYLIPDFEKFSFKTVCGAMGQLFFSLSLAMGIMVTYGSYIKDEVSLVKSVNQIEIFDTTVALLAGLLVIPIVYAFSGEAGLTANGPGLMFVSLPKIFAQMGGGRIMGLVFFVLVLFTAITSSVSIMEALVSSMMDKFKVTRGRACAITLIVAIVLGVPSSMGNGAWSHIKILGMDFLTFFDYLSNSVLMPIVALCTCILVGWVIGTKTITDEVTRNGEKFGRQKIYEVMIKYVAPVLLVIILVAYSLAQFGVIKM
ncbi:MAG: sodium-dependent transporter [Lachnospiraceae bacterium]|nr:sodium-dependent transporter [Lachnospiraceae bacterium]